MDFISELGSLALASRLRRLTERLTQEAVLLYRDLDIDFEPRWFAVFYLLSEQSPLCVVDVARMLGISHPAVNQIAGELIRKGLVSAQKDPHDKRKRMLILSEKGKQLVPTLKHVWRHVHGAVDTAILDSEQDVMASIEGLERALEKKSLQERFFEVRNLENYRNHLENSLLEPELTINKT